MDIEEQVKRFDDMIPVQKIRAVSALQDQDEEYKKLEPVRKSFEGRRERILEIVNIRDEYQIVEYETRIDDEWKKYFGVFIKFKNTNQITTTFDQALIVALCVKYDGFNTRLPVYIERALGSAFIETL